MAEELRDDNNTNETEEAKKTQSTMRKQGAFFVRFYSDIFIF